MEIETKDRALSAFLQVLDGRDPGVYVRELSGEECVQVHNLLKTLDDLLKKRWQLMGSPREGDEVL